jgi:hypothetical protein
MSDKPTMKIIVKLVFDSDPPSPGEKLLAGKTLQRLALTGWHSTSISIIKDGSQEFTMEKLFRCGALTEIPSGETVTPCHKLQGHDGDHEGSCLGSRAVWGDEHE